MIKQITKTYPDFNIKEYKELDNDILKIYIKYDINQKIMVEKQYDDNGNITKHLYYTKTQNKIVKHYTDNKISAIEKYDKDNNQTYMWDNEGYEAKWKYEPTSTNGNGDLISFNDSEGRFTLNKDIYDNKSNLYINKYISNTSMTIMLYNNPNKKPQDIVFYLKTKRLSPKAPWHLDLYTENNKTYHNMKNINESKFKYIFKKYNLTTPTKFIQNLY